MADAATVQVHLFPAFNFDKATTCAGFESPKKTALKPTLYNHLSRSEFLDRADPEIKQSWKDYRTFLHNRLPELQSKRLPFWRRTKESKNDTLRYCLNRHFPETGLALEFGVWTGTTIRMIAQRYPHRKIYGFDSFEGFPDDGRRDWQSDFSLDGKVPSVPANVSLIKGYFDETLPGFLEKHSGEDISFLHIDCDIYSSARSVLNSCGPFIRSGCIIVFDELLHNVPFLQNEMLAFYEWLRSSGRDFEWIAIRGKVMLIDEFLENRGRHPAKMQDWRAKGYEQEVAVRVI